MRIGIVNDMVMAQETLRRTVTSVPDHQVAWLAKDGAEAVAKAEIDRPDLILMDLIMPGMDGVEAIRQIMVGSPCPIVIVTSSVTGHMGRVYEAMGLGALDAVDTPNLGPAGDLKGARMLLDKIETIAKLIGRSTKAVVATVDLSPPKPRPDRSVSWPLVVLGSSTGGPSALAEILAGMPDIRDWSTVIIQHVDVAFAPGLARWLFERTGREVRLIEPGDKPLPGQTWLAATNDHLILDETSRFRYVVEPLAIHYRPSVDVFLRSVAERWPEPGASALLTGMGRDGAAGLLALRRCGWLTIAQDEASSVIWGMPRAAIQLGGADQVLPLSEIAQAITDRVRDRSHRLPGATQR